MVELIRLNSDDSQPRLATFFYEAADHERLQGLVDITDATLVYSENGSDFNALVRSIPITGKQIYAAEIIPINGGAFEGVGLPWGSRTGIDHRIMACPSTGYSFVSRRDAEGQESGLRVWYGLDKFVAFAQPKGGKLELDIEEPSVVKVGVSPERNLARNFIEGLQTVRK